MGEKKFSIVSSFNYLEHVITSNLDDELDVKKNLDNFLKRFHFNFRNFNRLNLDCQLYLFNIFSSPDYGLPLWNSKNIFNKQFFNSFNISYSNSLKMICGCPRYSSSHQVAGMCSQLLFKHLVNLIQARYLHTVMKHNQPLLILNTIFIKDGLFLNHVFKNFKTLYDINVLENEIDCICS